MSGNISTKPLRLAKPILRSSLVLRQPQPPHRLHTKEEEGDDDLTAPSAGFAPPSPPGQEAFIDAEVAGVAVIDLPIDAAERRVVARIS